MANLDLIPACARERAAKLIEAQDSVPVSPMRVTEDGGIELCAAAALAMANLDDAGERSDLLRRMQSEGSACLQDAFGRLGWPEEVCREVLIYNDRLAAEERKRQVVSFLTAD